MAIVLENARSQRLDPDLRDESPNGEELLFPSQSCSSSSSIGKNSDDEDDGGGEEVESPYNSINDLEESLPIRRGISSFYNGKSRSFMSLAMASSAPSIAEIGKPEDAYTRKRKNQLAFRHGWDRSGSICKRPIRASQSTLALAVAMGSSDSISSNDSCSSGEGASRLVGEAVDSSLPPPWRSFSVADLRRCHGRV